MLSPSHLNRTGPKNHTGAAGQHKSMGKATHQNQSADQPNRPGNSGLQHSSLTTHPLPGAVPSSSLILLLPAKRSMLPSRPTQAQRAHTPCSPPLCTHVTAAHTAAELPGGRESAAPSCCTHCCHTGGADASPKTSPMRISKVAVAAVHSNQAPVAPCPAETGACQSGHTSHITRAYPTTSQPIGGMAHMCVVVV